MEEYHGDTSDDYPEDDKNWTNDQASEDGLHFVILVFLVLLVVSVGVLVL